MTDANLDRPNNAPRGNNTNRSPNYPQLNIVQAIERIKKVYAAEHTHSVPDEVVAEALGYASLNGTSKGVLSALKKYGLLVPSGDGFRVSADAITLLELPINDPARSEALRRAALRPPVFKQLYEKYTDNLPSDSTLRHYLISTGFESRAADQVIRFYKETLDFVSKQSTSSVRNAADKDDVNPIPAVAQTETAATESRPTHETMPATTAITPQMTGQLRFQVSPSCIAEVSFTSEVTQEAINKLISYLELSMDLYPAKASAQRRQKDSRVKQTEIDSDDDYDADIDG